MPAPAEEVVEEIKKRGGTAVANFETVAEAIPASKIVKMAVDTYGKLDGVAILDTKDVPAALKRATLVSEQPRGVLGLGTMRTGAVFTRLDVQTLRSEP